MKKLTQPSLFPELEIKETKSPDTLNLPSYTVKDLKDKDEMLITTIKFINNNQLTRNDVWAILELIKTIHGKKDERDVTKILFDNIHNTRETKK